MSFFLSYHLPATSNQCMGIVWPGLTKVNWWRSNNERGQRRLAYASIGRGDLYLKNRDGINFCNVNLRFQGITLLLVIVLGRVYVLLLSTLKAIHN